MEGKKRKKSRMGRVLRGLLLVLLLLAVAGYGLVFHINEFSLQIHLNGEDEILLECGETYTEQGAQVRLYGTLFWQTGISLEKLMAQASSEVDPNRMGKQEIVYTVSLHTLSAQAKRTVHVIDSVPPEITLVEDTQDYVPGMPYVEPGYQAVDNVDGDITDRVVRREEAGQITYAVTDYFGNPAVAKRSVPGFDPQPPVITLEGGEAYSLAVGKAYQEPGYSAVDNLDGDLTERVSVEGTVDCFVPGVYPVVYRVADSGGNETELVRNVTVEAADWPDTEYPKGKTIYLTFDDGPGIHTPQLLDVLDAYGAKATFFVVDSGYDSLMKEIVDRGHSIGIHSVTHKYEEIYASPEAFFEDLYGMQEIIYQNTGVRTTLMRFPGGSSNAISRRYCEGIMTTLVDAVRDAGFQYFDWNVISGDAGETTKTEKVYENVIDGVQNHRVSVVLQHDIHYYSVAAVEKILQWGKRNGYTFRALEPSSPGFHQTVLN